MFRSAILLAAVALAVVALLPSAVHATEPNNTSATYEYHLEGPNAAQSADGDEVSFTGMGTFSVHPKSATGGGGFTLTEDGTTLSGTWSALDLVSFTPYGCGIVLGDPLPPNFCGGRLELRVLLTPSVGPAMEGILTIVCVIGDIPGQASVGTNATEGVRLVLPGVENYNQQVEGAMNIFILMA
jgi:hypothetical protein